MRVLLQFSQIAAAAAGGAEKVLPLLADAAVDIVGSNAAAVLAVQPNGEFVLVASRNLPDELSGWSTTSGAFGGEARSELLAACQGRFRQAHLLPMVSGSGLFGGLVLFFEEETQAGTEPLELAGGLVDLVATTLDKVSQLEEMRRAHASLRASQEVLVHSEKLRLLGQMSAGIAHDIRNLLNPMSLYLELIERAARRGDTNKVKDNITAAQDVLRHGVEIVGRLNEFSKASPTPTTHSVDPNTLAQEAVQVVKPRMTSAQGRLSVIEAKLGDPPPLAAPPGEVVSALVNLLVNAIDAMPEGGKIEVRTSAARGGVLLEVADNGPGMPSDIAEKALKPFFTTKGKHGTGLGLAMVDDFVRRNGGSLSLTTAPGEGTTVSMWFPSVARE
jgi:signal transduction histidine kinase